MLGMQVSSGMDSEMSSQDFMWAVAQTSWGGAARSGLPEREQDSGGAPTDRSCAHVSFNSNQILCKKNDFKMLVNYLNLYSVSHFFWIIPVYLHMNGRIR